MRSYGQYCSIARALDVVGDRWTLLIVRELLLKGSCRFTDIKNGLPGIAPNLLSARLKDLEGAGLVSHTEAPPPVATALYALTDAGRSLEPILHALGLWGLRLMADDEPADTLQAHWLAYAPSWFATDAEPDGPSAAIQLVASGEKAVVEFCDGRIETRVGEVSNPDLVIEGPRRAVLGLLMGVMDTTNAIELGLTMTGRRDLLNRLAHEDVPAPDLVGA